MNKALKSKIIMFVSMMLFMIFYHDIARIPPPLQGGG